MTKVRALLTSSDTKNMVTLIAAVAGALAAVITAIRTPTSTEIKSIDDKVSAVVIAQNTDSKEFRNRIEELHVSIEVTKQKQLDLFALLEKQSTASQQEYNRTVQQESLAKLIRTRPVYALVHPAVPQKEQPSVATTKQDPPVLTIKQE
jgi:anti-sigma-K factor RskA